MNKLGQSGHRISSLSAWFKLVGVPSTMHWMLIRISQVLGFGEPRSWRFQPRHVKHSLIARLGDSSDMPIFRQIFQEEQYSALRNIEGVSLVLDLGANVGYSSAYFLNCFPGARVVAVEPDPRNFSVCKANLESYGDRVILVHGAVWSECTKLSLATGTFGDGREWATRVLPAPDGDIGKIPAWDVGSLIDLAGCEFVDLLKVDIEKAELAVFGESAKAWLPRVRNICIELHGPDCEEAFFNAMKPFDFDLEHSPEMTICRNLSYKQESVGRS